jgi:hypothetical protein
MALLVRGAAGLTTMVAAGPVPVSVLQESATEAGDAVNRTAARAGAAQKAKDRMASKPAAYLVKNVEGFRDAGSMEVMVRSTHVSAAGRLL